MVPFPREARDFVEHVKRKKRGKGLVADAVDFAVNRVLTNAATPLLGPLGGLAVPISEFAQFSKHYITPPKTPRKKKRKLKHRFQVTENNAGQGVTRKNLYSAFIENPHEKVIPSSTMSKNVGNKQTLHATGKRVRKMTSKESKFEKKVKSALKNEDVSNVMTKQHTGVLYRQKAIGGPPLVGNSFVYETLPNSNPMCINTANEILDVVSRLYNGKPVTGSDYYNDIWTLNVDKNLPAAKYDIHSNVTFVIRNQTQNVAKVKIYVFSPKSAIPLGHTPMVDFINLNDLYTNTKNPQYLANFTGKVGMWFDSNQVVCQDKFSIMQYPDMYSKWNISTIVSELQPGQKFTHIERGLNGSIDLSVLGKFVPVIGPSPNYETNGYSDASPKIGSKFFWITADYEPMIGQKAEAAFNVPKAVQAWDNDNQDFGGVIWEMVKHYKIRFPENAPPEYNKYQFWKIGGWDAPAETDNAYRVGAELGNKMDQD